MKECSVPYSREVSKLEYPAPSDSVRVQEIREKIQEFSAANEL